MTYKHLTDCLESNLIDTAEATAITQEHRFCTPKEWIQQPPKGTKKKITGIPSATYAFETTVSDAAGITCPGLKVAAHHTRCRRVDHEKTTFTLFRMEACGDQLRIVQVEAAFPLPPTGPSSFNWPHVHFGKKRDDLHLPSDTTFLSMSDVAACFEQSSNIEFHPNISDPEEFVLTP